jgi:Ca2+-binding RTX toxin-like protein
VGATFVLVAASCAGEDHQQPGPVAPTGDTTGIGELDQPLTPLLTACVYTPPTTTPAVVGAMTVVLSASVNEVALLSLSGDRLNILVNGKLCFPAGSTTPSAAATRAGVKKITITGTTKDDTVILDFMNGPFAMGGTVATQGIFVALGTGVNRLKIRGTADVDSYTVGASGIHLGAIVSNPATTASSVKDITITASGTNYPEVTLSAGGGNDVLSGAGAEGALTTTGKGATGTPYPGVVMLYGGAGDDSLKGGLGNDTLNGGDGNNHFYELATKSGNDTYIGGTCTTTCTNILDYSLRTAPLTLKLDGTAGSGDLSVATGSPAESDTIGLDIQEVWGGAGDDTFLFANRVRTDQGKVKIDGKGGTNTVSYLGRTLGVVVDLTTGFGGALNDCASTAPVADLTDPVDVLAGATGTKCDQYVSIANIVGTTLADVLMGDANVNVLYGMGGSNGKDYLFGLAGDDTFMMPDLDTFDAIIDGGTGSNTVDYSGYGTLATNKNLTLNLTTGRGFATAVSTVYDSFANIQNVTGGLGDDIITGKNGMDSILCGGPGDDTITGGDGNDVIDGGPGANTIDGAGGDMDICFNGGGGTFASVANCE